MKRLGQEKDTKLLREKSGEKKTSSPLEELLRKMVEGIDSPLVRARIHALIENDRLGNPLSHNTLQKEAREMLTALREEGGLSENRGD